MEWGVGEWMSDGDSDEGGAGGGGRAAAWREGSLTVLSRRGTFPASQRTFAKG